MKKIVGLLLVLAIDISAMEITPYEHNKMSLLLCQPKEIIQEILIFVFQEKENDSSKSYWEKVRNTQLICKDMWSLIRWGRFYDQQSIISRNSNSSVVKIITTNLSLLKKYAEEREKQEMHSIQPYYSFPGSNPDNNRTPGTGKRGSTENSHWYYFAP